MASPRSVKSSHSPLGWSDASVPVMCGAPRPSSQEKFVPACSRDVALTIQHARRGARRGHELGQGALLRSPRRGGGGGRRARHIHPPHPPPPPPPPRPPPPPPPRL